MTLPGRFCVSGEASEALAKLAAPGFKFALAGNSAAISRCKGALSMPTKPQLPERSSRAMEGPSALDGLLVIDFTRVVAGPACTQTLADFGAQVIKIENPDGGDDTRAYEHAEIGGESAAYLSLNRNKRGIALDLAVPEAREIALDLIRKADVVVENFSSGVMKKFGLDYDAVAPLNPRLVYCSISAYGRSGPFASRPRLRSHHAGGERLHVAQRICRRSGGSYRPSHRGHGDGDVCL
ncbi:hypothetical protein ABH985_004341 [Bradyrhizobium ottawaense]